jgi:tripartite-type tricarboxylate transporter receptor subunit TctC
MTTTMESTAMKKTFLAMAAVLGMSMALTAAGDALAQDSYPNKQIKFIVPFSPGGGIDILARTIGQKLGDDWKVPVVIDNRPGASGNIGTEAAARAAPDGYTVLTTANTIIMVPSLYKNVPFDPIKDFVPVVPLAIGSLALVARPTLNVKSVKEFIELAKASGGKLNYGSPGNGTPHHLAMELVKQRTGIEIMHIPYKGSAGLVTDVISGQVDVAFLPVHQVLPFVKSGKMLMLAAGGIKRTSVTPDVPSMAQAAGISDIDVDMWYGLYLPAGTSKGVVAKMNREVNAILRMPDVGVTLNALGLQPSGGTPEQLADLTAADLNRWAKVIRQAKITAD